MNPLTKYKNHKQRNERQKTVQDKNVEIEPMKKTQAAGHTEMKTLGPQTGTSPTKTRNERENLSTET